MLQISMIKAIIFDIGGVIQGLDWSFIVNSLLDLKGDLEINTFRSAFYHDKKNFFDLYALSKISKEDFWGMVASRLNIDKKNIDKLSEKFELLYSFVNNDIIDLIKALKYNYKLFTLSNSCPEIERKIIKDNIYPHLFDKMYFSHITGKRKPDQEAYLQITAENLIKPEECIFIDNDAKNILGAKSIGMNAILISSPDLLKRDLFALLQKIDKSDKIKIGYTTGVFDLFHQGHLNLLRNAKKYCDKLVVGVTTDELSLIFKGKKPIVPFSERVEILRAIKYVDEVVPQENVDKFEAWKKYNFDVMFASDTPTEKWPHVEAEFLNKFQIANLNPPKIIRLPYTPGISTTLRKEVLKGR